MTNLEDITVGSVWYLWEINEDYACVVRGVAPTSAATVSVEIEFLIDGEPEIILFAPTNFLPIPPESLAELVMPYLCRHAEKRLTRELEKHKIALARKARLKKIFRVNKSTAFGRTVVEAEYVEK